MSKIKSVFKADDGSDHPTEAAAEGHNKLLVASKALKLAADDVRRCLGETAMTADGQPLEMRRSRDYWRIADCFYGLPQLVRVSFWPHSVDVDEDRGTLTIREFVADRKDYITLRVNELYADERKARQAHLAALEKRWAEVEETIDGIRKQYERTP